jgi:outer membrane protein
LIREGQPQKALEILNQLPEAERTSAEYHYLRGIALMDSGNLPEAISALKRSLAINPKLLQAKAELGRAYVLNGEAINAYTTFDEVRDGTPPPEVLAGMERFIGAMARGANHDKSLSGALSLTLGHDTNVNSGTSATEITLPLFGSVPATLGASANPQSDNFLMLGGNLAAQHAVSGALTLTGQAGFNGKFNQDGDNRVYDNGLLDIALGGRYTQGAEQFGAAVEHGKLRYGEDTLRSETGVALQWRHLTQGPIELGLNYRHTRLDYPNSPVLNARRDVLTLSALPAFFGHRLQNAPALGSVYLGEERPKNAAAKALGNRFWGLRAAYLHRLTPATTLFGSGGYEDRTYGAADSVFLRVRKDQRIDVALGALHELRSNLALIPGVQWIRNDSNIVVNDYERTLYSLTLRLTF